MGNKTTIKSNITRTYNKTVENMRKLGTFKPEFDAPVRRYAELRVQYEVLTER